MFKKFTDEQLRTVLKSFDCRLSYLNSLADKAYSLPSLQDFTRCLFYDIKSTEAMYSEASQEKDKRAAKRAL
jgi:hypothetical protein